MNTSKKLFILFILVLLISGYQCDNDESENDARAKRASHRGQTQSQYLSFSDNDDGKAEAEATKGGSRATVYGKNGMGQAQSQSMGGDCSECYGSDTYRKPGRISRPGYRGESSENEYGSRGGGGGSIRPGEISDGRYGGRPGEGSDGRFGGQERPGDISGGQLKPNDISGGQRRPGDISGGQLRPGEGSDGRFGGQERPGDISGGQLRPNDISGGQRKPGDISGGQLRPGEGSDGRFGGQERPGDISGGQLRPSDISGGQRRPGDISGGQGISDGGYRPQGPSGGQINGGGSTHGGGIITDSHGKNFVPLPYNYDHDIINPGSLTVLVGTGGPRQTVIKSPVDGPFRVYSSEPKIPGVSQQTVYTPGSRDGLTVLVGTGGPVQTVHHSGHHSYKSTHTDDFDSVTAHDLQKYGNRGDQPGYLITPGQIGGGDYPPDGELKPQGPSGYRPNQSQDGYRPGFSQDGSRPNQSQDGYRPGDDFKPGQDGYKPGQIGYKPGSDQLPGVPIHDKDIGSSIFEPESSTDELPPENLEKLDEEDDAFSQAETSIKGGEVSASAQGKKNGGAAQTQVSGTYTGKGSFSATAQTSDSDRSAQASISGGKEGAMTSAQGQGGAAKSQSQIAVDAKTGGTSATAQSGGSKHESQSEVVANEKGGLADAQASGPGQTSSQAQIGFRPQEEDSNEAVYNVFNGGGTASAQSGTHTGQSQSQISGKFKYGISYHGAAQAASGTKEQVKEIRDKSKSLFRNIELFGKNNRKVEITHTEEDKLRSKTSKQVTVTSANPTLISSSKVDDKKPEEEEDYDDGDEEDEEEDDEYYTQTDANIAPKSFKLTTTTDMPHIVVTTIPGKNNEETTLKIFTQTSGSQQQKAVLVNPDKNPVRLVQTQNGKTFTYPPGKDQKKADLKQEEEREDPQTDSFEQVDSNPHEDITISKTTQKIKYKTRYLPSKTVEKNNENVKPETFVSVTKSLSGSVNENDKENGKVTSTYFTKSSTCGQFKFSCNIVYGSEGRSRICRPKQNNPKC